MPLNVAVLGAGHLGKIHIKCILQSKALTLVGFYDPSESAQKLALEQFPNIQLYTDLDELMDAAEVIDIVTPTIQHYRLAEKAIQKGKHIFIEKPVTSTPEEAHALRQIAKNKPIKIQVGHVERFNPAYLALQNYCLNPMFIEAHRLSMFNPRGTDVSVVFDLMIHDLDILLQTVRSPVKQIWADGVSVVSSNADIANARIEFENGCTANVTASRISLKNMRKMRFFQSNAYISLDFLEKTAQIITLVDDPALAGEFMIPLETKENTKYLTFAQPDVQPINAIQMELESLANSIRSDTRPTVSLDDGLSALQLATEINNALNEKLSKQKENL